MEKKRKQHYVFRYYLDSWNNEEHQLFCLRNEQIFGSKSRGVAHQNDFYRIAELSSQSENFLNLFIARIMVPEVRASCLELLERFTAPFKEKNRELEQGTWSKEKEREFDIRINNLEEDIHWGFEEKLKPYLSQLRGGDASFFKDPQQKQEFLKCISVQASRTKRSRITAQNSVKTALQGVLEIEKAAQIYGFDMEKMYPVMSHMLAETLTYSLVHASSYQLVLLNNDTNIPLITGDQPAIAIPSPLREAVSVAQDPTQLQIYYPISPRKAILITNLPQFPPLIDLSEFQIAKCNEAIYTACETQVYANEEEVLRNLILEDQSLSAKDAGF